KLHPSIMHNLSFADIPIMDLNLSADGVGVEVPSDSNFAQSDVVGIFLSIATGGATVVFCLYGSVVWVLNGDGEKKMGIKFINMKKEIEEKINAFVFEKRRKILYIND